MESNWHLLAWGANGWGDEFAWGLLMTLKVSGAAYIVALLFGFLGAAGKLSANRAARAVAGVYTTLVRALPEMLVVLLLYYSVASGIEQTLKAYGLVDSNFTVSPFLAAVVALAFVAGAFMTEVLRSAFLAVPAGQVEAAEAIGMSRAKVFTRVVLPLMLRHAIPGLGNMWLNITKDSAIISVLGAFSELLYTGYKAAATTKQYILFYGLTAFLFLLITLVSVFAIRWLERYYARGHR